MADAKPTTAPCAPTASPAVPGPRLAAPGYGKRSAPDQARRRPGDFSHLPEREAFIAAFVDRLPDGAAMDVKTLAAAQPRYGQQAVRSALTRLSAAGHLRRVQETVGDGRSQWVYRTYFTRTARDDTWWRHFLTGNAPPQLPPDERPPTSEPLTPTPEPAISERAVREPEAPEPEAPEPAAPESAAPEPPPRSAAPLRAEAASNPHPAPPPRSAAYAALAALGTADPRMMLSAAECAALEDLAAQWLAHGVSATHLITALTAGLPPEVHSPGAIARTRLTAKLPPAPPPEATSPRAPTRIMECTECGVPGRPEALPGGLCRPCRGDIPPPDPAADHLRAQRTAHFAHLCRSGSRSRPGSAESSTQRVGNGSNHHPNPN
ncbi:MarR family transcriptional regulator [Streptomyces albofaciens]|uniref:MarR family transcriptional regulator n=1 Tax=Streptomyces albofaciens TaxID=66866 RepID=UPI00123C3458|nr:MarR family transcriptional regulator [Streptomyces albofaciens]